MRGFLHIIGAVVGVIAVTPVAHAGEFAVLSTGYRLEADRHEVDGDRIRLFHQGGETTLAAALIVRFEARAEDPPSPVAAVVRAEPAPAEIIALPKTPKDLASAAAHAFDLPEAFVRSVMRAESGFQTRALSPKGAIGLMQLMPGTARDLGVDPYDPEQNALGGAKYLRDLLARYEGRPDQVLLALAAYNAGPAAVEKYHGVPPFAETREYIWRVVRQWAKDNPGK